MEFRPKHLIRPGRTEISPRPSGWRRGGGCTARGLVAATAAAFSLLLPACSPGGHETPERVILIVIDTLRRDHLSCYGSVVPTPSIDALAEKGQLFTHAYASFHQTSVSMASLFTGRIPALESGKDKKSIGWNSLTSCGLFRFSAARKEERCFSKSLPTIAGFMSEQGYRTIGVNSNAALFRPGGYDRGFVDWVEVGGKRPHGSPKDAVTPPGNITERNGRAINRAVTRALERRFTDRFFLYVHYMEVHDYLASDAPYAKGVVNADAAVGELLEKLDDLDLLDDAVVILTSDHGERLGERQVLPGTLSHFGNPSFEQLLQVPLIVSPARFDDTESLVRGDQVYNYDTAYRGSPRRKREGSASG